MTNLLTQGQVYELARKVGFSHANARIASAIALCESPGSLNNTQASDFDGVGDIELANSKWGYSYGGFQIRSLREHKGTGKYRDEERLLEPEFNARSARIIKRSQGWRAWSVYQSGAYKAYLQDLYPPPPNTYIVLSGDTLSKIGYKLGINWADLARWNNLHSPYTIYIGQVLLLQDPTGA